MKQRTGCAMRDRCVALRWGPVAGVALAIATGSGALADPIMDRGFFGPGATLITFEMRAGGEPVLSPDLDPLMEGETLPLPAAEYAPLGVTFDTDIFWVNDGNPLFDAAQLLASMAGQGGSPTNAIPSASIDAFEMLFFTPVDAFGFLVVTHAEEVTDVTFTAYDATDALVDTVSFGGAFVDDTISNAGATVAYGFMGISRSDEQSPISRVVVTKGAAILDDLVFTPIPAPGAVALLGAAGLMTGARRRRERR